MRAVRKLAMASVVLPAVLVRSLSSSVPPRQLLEKSNHVTKRDELLRGVLSRRVSGLKVRCEMSVYPYLPPPKCFP